VGSGVEVLGTSAGQVAEIVLDPETKFYAVVGIDESMKPFVRQDSKVFIRKQFGIAGAAYLDITRGVGPPLDWDYAVLTAGEETAPTASVGELSGAAWNARSMAISKSNPAAFLMSFLKSCSVPSSG
jgi:phospholipid/cholesterol/gamma-HCH transport system substrate-binding protein